MKKKARGTVALVCGIICVLCEVLFITLNLAFKYDFDGRTDVLSSVILLALGLYLCYLGIKMRKQDN